MNGKFFTMPEEKQKRIINAAYVVFAGSSYQKASMSRIAAAGGISKSLLFHYSVSCSHSCHIKCGICLSALSDKTGAGSMRFYDTQRN